MGRVTWNKIKNSKGFYVVTYRRAATILLFSVSLNALLAGGIYYTYFNQPQRAYYATNGERSPIELTAMSAPNDTPYALLATYPESQTTVRKNIPE